MKCRAQYILITTKEQVEKKMKRTNERIRFNYQTKHILARSVSQPAKNPYQNVSINFCNNVISWKTTVKCAQLSSAIM